MYSIEARNANEALANGLSKILLYGKASSSRNGDVLYLPEPVCITYLAPWRRVVTSKTRDANPFFHVAEALWMLAGRNDLAFLQKFVSTFDRYSDDGLTLHGAYGHRWRSHFGGLDQLTLVIDELQANPDSRRAVVGMWNPEADLPMLFSGGKDVPCNTQIYFALRDGKLDMTVTNRSNDAVFGCFGANLVHFSFLQEYMAGALGAEIGKYHQITNNLHVYTHVVSTSHINEIIAESASDFHRGESASRIALLSGVTREEFDLDLVKFFEGDPAGCTSPFLTLVAIPLVDAYLQRKNGTMTTEQAIERVKDVGDDEWRVAATEWLQRRLA